MAETKLTQQVIHAFREGLAKGMPSVYICRKLGIDPFTIGDEGECGQAESAAEARRIFALGATTDSSAGRW